ncbi:SWI/SNF complex subunit SWI3A [Ricinus communis]|uniref:DNA binding protein, putative n=1 Tax=Ricinus communis TaxID=3988 RepID=B9RAB3_RICCO|nr:SWI/SNF complex subunit SWI3A [Ricinus communis]EEF51740.1 DNA binding protein, putative [Ricinus communis]|eukprot:XP_002511138.1 SWI/SNF complex subunit SWI3A [Ricinus communis]
METPHHDPTRREEPEFDLYTIPSYSSWFAWDNIHETERAALKEFFDGSSITRTPKIYKEYRDFIINKYREDPSRRLTFTEIRKSLVGDVTLLNKVFRFLDNSGLINFGADSAPYNDSEREEIGNFRVEDGPPNGIRVVAMPNSLKPLSVPPQNAEIVENVLRLPPLTSHSDVFGKQIGFVCGNCGETCNSGRYECSKGEYILCTNCFNNGDYGQNNSKDDYKFNDSVDHSSGTVWSEAETILLLESVLKHGDNWDLVVRDVQTKSKLECIAKLIELPFRNLLLSSTLVGDTSGLSGSADYLKPVPVSSSEKQDAVDNIEGLLPESQNVSEQNGDAADEGSPLKRKRIVSLSDAGSCLMKQVALISTMAGPDVASAAAKAAIGALCDETSCPREIFGGKEDFPAKGLWSPTLCSRPERVLYVKDTEIKERSTQLETEDTSLGQNDIPLTLRLRTAVATSLGAAAAHAKLLADEEDQKIEKLVTTVVEAQLKKLQYKIKHFDNLELIMEKEYAELEELQESLIEERMDVVQRAIMAGLSKWRDHSAART